MFERVAGCPSAWAFQVFLKISQSLEMNLRPSVARAGESLQPEFEDFMESSGGGHTSFKGSTTRSHQWQHISRRRLLESCSALTLPAFGALMSVMMIFIRPMIYPEMGEPTDDGEESGLNHDVVAAINESMNGCTLRVSLF